MTTRRRLSTLCLLLTLLGACSAPATPVPVTTPLVHGNATPTTVVLPSPSPRPATDTPARPQATLAATVTTLPTTNPTPLVSGPPNVIYIVADSLRADHVSAYNAKRRTTPNLDSLLAAEGARFDNVTSPAPWTCPANAAILAGRSASSLHSSWLDLNNTLPQDARTLAEVLKDRGYFTAAFVTNSCVDSGRGMAQGFDVFDDSYALRKDADAKNKALAEEVNALAMNFIQTQWAARTDKQQPLFLWLYYMEPHVYYNPPPPYDTLYDPDYTGPFTPQVYAAGYDVVTGKLVPGARDVEHIEALYDGEISYWDAALGQMLAYLQQQGLLDNTLIVVTGDHGEQFGEHGKWVHGSALYEEQVRVPLIMRYSGRIMPGTIVTTPVSSMDLMPTILDYAGADIPKDVQAVSLRPALQGRALPARAIYSELDGLNDPKHWGYWIAPRENLRSAQQGGWKLILHAGDESANELYELQPQTLYETDNLWAQQLDKGNALRILLQTFFELGR